MKWNRHAGRFDDFVPPGICSTGIEEGIALAGAAATAASPYIGAASLGMSILGAAGQSAAQRQAGDVAYQNALLRNQQAQQQATLQEQQAALLDQQANQQKIAAGEEIAAGQRQKIEAIRRGGIQAARAKAVMAASGAGVDDNLVASLQGEGNYAGDVAEFNAGERGRVMNNQGEVTRYNAGAARYTAAGTRWAGNAGVGVGAQARDASYNAADMTLIGGVGKGVLSFASKYGGAAPGRSATGAGDYIDSDIASWSQYGQNPNDRAALERVLA